MDEHRLQEALNHCIDRLAAGHTMADCLAAYPDLAPDLRPLLELGQSTVRARVPRSEVDAMRSRLDFHIHTLIAETDFKPNRFRLPQGAAVLLVASLALLIAGIFVLAPRDPQVANDPTPTATATHIPETTVTATLTATVTTSDTPEPTTTGTPTLTTTPSPTMTPSATMTATATATSPSTPTKTVCAPSPPEEWARYRVQTGDTLSEIAFLTGSTVAELSAVNCIEGNLIIVGQWLHVPYLWQSAVSTGTDVGDDDPDASDDDHSGSGSDNSGSGSDNSGFDDDESENDHDDPDDDPDDDHN